MQIGAMNNPQNDVFDELRWMTALEMDFIDLTLEPPAAAAWQINVKDLREAIADAGLNVVGHTAYYLPIASPFEEVRRGAVAEVRRCFDAFAQLGAKWVNFHPDHHTPQHERPFFVKRNLQSAQELLDHARQLGMGLMVENIPGEFNTVKQLGELLDPIPDLGLHLDLGHCNLQVRENTARTILAVYGNRLRHVHLHDNKGGHHDLHLPLGTGTVDAPRCVRELKAVGYDGTITLEVFSPDRHFLRYSRDLLRHLWDQVA
jgi:sugar phosphate isomerase/epimerase